MMQGISSIAVGLIEEHDVGPNYLFVQLPLTGIKLKLMLSPVIFSFEMQCVLNGIVTSALIE